MTSTKKGKVSGLHQKSEKEGKYEGIRSIHLTSIHRINLEQSAAPRKQGRRVESNIDLPRTNQSK